MKQQELAIDGMSCGHCVKSLSKELSAIKGLTVQEVVIGKAVIEYDPELVNDEDILHAIDEAGFRLAMRMKRALMVFLRFGGKGHRAINCGT